MPRPPRRPRRVVWALAVLGGCVGLLAVLTVVLGVAGGHSRDTATPTASPSTAPTERKAAPSPTDAHSTRVSRAQLGDAWPLSVPAGRVGCDPDHRAALTFTADGGSGRAYALNGAALVFGYPPVDPIVEKPDKLPVLRVATPAFCR